MLVASMADPTKTSFSNVVVVPHPTSNTDKATFVKLSIVSGLDVKMTTDHLVLGGACDKPLSLVTAGSLRDGDCLQTVSGSEVVSATITSESQGVHTVVTASSDDLLVVNGIVASPFAANHLVANSFYNIHRALHKIAPTIASHPVVAKVMQAFGEMVTGLAH